MELNTLIIFNEMAIELNAGINLTNVTTSNDKIGTNDWQSFVLIKKYKNINSRKVIVATSKSNLGTFLDTLKKNLYLLRVQQFPYLK